MLCPQPSLTERTVDDHQQLPARYGAMGSVLRGRLAAVLLHHVGGPRPPWGIFLVPLGAAYSDIHRLLNTHTLPTFRVENLSKNQIHLR